ncbi:MAG: hypothetical protein R3350_06635, partial [Saprospiraceae bacterium]|nr:hypothetical protein [Saprospiraceae bacterium]
MYEILIGLAFTLLMFSLLATTVQEMLAVLFSLRGRTLVKGLQQMLAREEDEQQWKFFENSFFFQHLRSRFLWIKRLPSYLSSDSFYRIIKEVLEKNQEDPAGKSIGQMIHDLPEGSFKEALQRLYEEALEEGV